MLKLYVHTSYKLRHCSYISVEGSSNSQECIKTRQHFQE